MAEVKSTSIPIAAWNAAQSKSRFMQRMNYDPTKSTAVVEDDDTVTLTEYDAVIQDIDTDLGIGTLSNQTWDEAQDKKHLIRRLGLNPRYINDIENDDGTVTLENIATPAAPSDLAVTDEGDTTIDLEWMDNSNNEDFFAILRSTNGISYSEIATVGPGVTTYHATGLTNDLLYYFKVLARNNDIDSDPSDAATGTPTNPTPPVLSGLTKSGSPGWNAAAWAALLSAAGDVELTIVTSGSYEMVMGLISATPGVVPLAWQNPNLDYGILTYASSQTVKMESGNPDFGSQVFPYLAYVAGTTTFTAKRVGTDIILQIDGVTHWTISGVSASTPLMPVCYGDHNEDMIVSATWNGSPLAWTDFAGGISAI